VLALGFKPGTGFGSGVGSGQQLLAAVRTGVAVCGRLCHISVNVKVACVHVQQTAGRQMHNCLSAAA
jgi:hypothetical protein